MYAASTAHGSHGSLAARPETTEGDGDESLLTDMLYAMDCIAARLAPLGMELWRRTRIVLRACDAF